MIARPDEPAQFRCYRVLERHYAPQHVPFAARIGLIESLQGLTL